MSAVQQMLMGAGGGATDPYYANVSLLLHMDGSNGSTTFTDNSSNVLAVSSNGSASVTTAAKKFGTGSANIDAVTKYLQIADTALLTFGTADFTVEGWFQPTGAGNEKTFYTHGLNSVGGLSFYIGTGGLRFRAAGTNDLVYSASISNTVFSHIAFVRNGNTRLIFLDGVQVAADTLSFNANDAIATDIGATPAPASNYRYTGYIDDLRITKGVARYTANFTPPTAAFPNS